jgi:hypothetical protein
MYYYVMQKIDHNISSQENRKFFSAENCDHYIYTWSQY